MTNELVHSSVGTALSQAEWEDVNNHVCNNSTQGDILYVCSSGTIKRLAAGTAGSALITGGAIADPAWGPGTWSTWAPTLNQGGAVGCTVDYADYCRIGTVILAQLRITATAAGAVGNAIQIGNLPAAIAPVRYGATRHCGSGIYNDAEAALYTIELIALTTATLNLIGYNATDYFGANPAVTIANTDILTVSLMYQTT